MSASELEPILSRFTEIFHSLTPESDRGCVLVVGAMVERVLEQHIEARLLLKVDSHDELTSRSSNGPIATFSSKINLAYRLGLFPPNERKLYHQLRELRNACAHDIARQDFAADHFKSRVRNIIEQSPVFWEAVRVHVVPAALSANPPASVTEFVEGVGWRVAFEFFFSLVVAHKQVAITRVPRVAKLFETPNVLPSADA